MDNNSGLGYQVNLGVFVFINADIMTDKGVAQTSQYTNLCVDSTLHNMGLE